MFQEEGASRGHGITPEVLRKKEKFKDLTDEQAERIINQLEQLAELSLRFVLQHK